MIPRRPPIAPRHPERRTHHGDGFVDDYEWLRDKDAPEVRAHLEAENAYTEARTAGLTPLRDAVFEEIRSRVQETDLSVPVRDGGWWYYSRTVEGRQYALHCRAPAAADDWTPPVLAPGVAVPGEQVLLDGNAEAEGHEFFALGSFAVSDDGTLLAFAVDTAGDERYTLRIKDLRTGELLGDEIPGTFPGAVFSPDGRYVFYPTVDDAWRPDTVWRHRVGTGRGDDVRVFTEPDERYWLGIGVTRSRRYIVIELGSKITSESWILGADDPAGEFRVVLPRSEGVEYEIDHAVVGGDDRLLILHNADGAENFALAQAPVDQPGRMTEVIAYRDDVRLEQIDVFAGHVAVGYRSGAIPRIGVMAVTASGFGPVREIGFDEELYSAGLGATSEWESPLLRVGQTSFVTPARIYDYEFSTGELHLRKQQPVLPDPSGRAFDPADYEQKREWATAPDGTRIPISIIRRVPGTDGPAAPAPTLLYGYGSYEISVDPEFSIARLSLLDRGMVYAVAHVRGGGEMGRRWYDDGKQLAKRNTFTDFVACTRHLVDSGLTTPAQLVAEGGSAGGLLMGAVANIAPELFAGILAVVPFVDPLTSILDPSLPLTVIEWDEWGDPLHDPEVYRYMKTYSPYENVENRQYPAILAVTSINDTRVLYVEPAKWVARLREVVDEKTSEGILLKTEMAAGHGGVSGRYDKWRQTAFEYAWVLTAAGAA
ncbi:S9 family peptidase [Tomitella fengzijianii]|uniref:S9 family peptidase n=1 Tax=Tomitella fengzijianii TaxID=2597660 RepID=A0A516X1A4_9ACTN|nr:S9 family peptidase [Tomitella fengzijianii]QDQ96848.1 S9 family peptidase [Tomitella fengzijianii]